MFAITYPLKASQLRALRKETPGRLRSCARPSLADLSARDRAPREARPTRSSGDCMRPTTSRGRSTRSTTRCTGSPRPALRSSTPTTAIRRRWWASAVRNSSRSRPAWAPFARSRSASWARWRDRSSALFARARGLLMPIRWDEPFGMVMIEALACGTPVIAFPEGAARELVIDGKTGFLAGDEREMDAQSAGYPALRRRRRRHRLRAHVSLRRAPARRERTARC